MAADRLPRLSPPDPDRDLEIKLEGRATFLNHAFETYSAVVTALKRRAPDALASKAAVASQWVARNHDEVGRKLDGAIGNADTLKAEGELAARIRRLPALRSDLVARLEQLQSTTVERGGGLEALLSAAIRRSHLAWSRYERDWQLAGGAVLRIPDGFTVTEARKHRVIVEWNTSWSRPHDRDISGWGHSGRFELAAQTLVIPSWLFRDRHIRLSAIRTNEQRRDRVNHLHLYGTDTEGIETELFAIPTLYDAEFICAVICHFTSARRDSHRLR
jgi:hypothetical protein